MIRINLLCLAIATSLLSACDDSNNLNGSEQTETAIETPITTTIETPNTTSIEAPDTTTIETPDTTTIETPDTTTIEAPNTTDDNVDPIIETGSDTTAPIITLIGESTLFINANEIYVDSGATAIDETDGELGVTKSGEVDYSTSGIYVITYTAIDASGNSASVQRTITVVENDTTPPVITLIGESEITLYLGDTYNDSGATALDETDGEVAVAINDTVNTSNIGSYNVTYVATDSAGNTATVHRIVNIASTSSVEPIAFSTTSVKLHGGGTHNHIVYSPDGNYRVAFADVGGTRYGLSSDDKWQYTPTLGDNASRQVAGGSVTDSGIVYQLVGNGNSSGALQEVNLQTGVVVELVDKLNVRGNSTTPGDTGGRPRPVGWLVMYDELNDLIYYATGDGVGRYNRATSTDDGIIALAGESCRGFAHYNHGVLNNPSKLIVSTTTQGLMKLTSLTATVVATPLSTPGFTRFEDAAYITEDDADDSLIAAGNETGVFKYLDDGTGADITPTQNSGTGANGSTTRWTAVAVSGSTAALGMVNPDSASEWIYRANNISTATAADWTDVTTTPATMQLGSQYNQPANRLLGKSGSTGNNLTGTYSMAFDPSDPDVLTIAANLSLYRSTDFTTAANWSSYNDDLSMGSLTDAHIDADGNLLISASDHNTFVLAADELLTGEPTRIGVSGIGDGWSIDSVGTGTDKVTLFCPASDHDAFDPDNAFAYHRGAGVPDDWTNANWSTLQGAGSLEASQVPRPGGVFGWDNKDGTYTAIVWADGLGFVRSAYSLATDSWSDWAVQASGPTSNLMSEDQNQERQIVGASDGSVMFGIQLKTGDVWRSIDQGVNWTLIASGTTQDVRTGRMAYWADTDTLAMSNGNGLYKITDASTTATKTAISGISTPCMIDYDSQGRLYAHVRGAGIVDLLRFNDFQSASSITDAEQIADQQYRTRVGDLSTNLNIGISDGVEYGITVYQGAGAVQWTVPVGDE